ncbi:PspC domain-containing protein [Vallitalea okinawensis]|uniref:PspC domain-containing protein n=1 Tax=Vallitalea okinawensis TaxID=2078660 RepID=UPI0013009554|nr:PspC domain-containing protein [Vallitalea okinawensis]
MREKLYKSRNNKIMFGVCGGLGEYLGVDPSIIRIIFVLASFLDGIGILIYLVMALIIPSNNGEYIIDVEINNGHNGEKRGIDPKNRNMLAGLVFIVAGAYFLLEIIFPQFLGFDIVISVALILLGCYVIITGKRGNSNE